MPKITRKGLVKKCDNIVSEFVRKRDKQCVVCGSTERLGNGHVFSRIAHSTRWDITPDGNCHAQCWPCNYRHEFDPYPYLNWYRQTFGDDKLEELHARFRQTRKYKDFQLQELYEEVKKQLDELEP